MTWPTALKSGFFALVLAAGISESLVHLVGPDFSRLPGDLIDSRFVGYVLEHGYLWLTGRAPSFWSPGFYYPMPDALALSDNMLGALPLYALLRVLLPTPEYAMAALTAFFFVLNFTCSVVLFTCCRVRFEAAVLAAYPVAFGIAIAAQSGHPQCLQLYPAAIGLMTLLRLLQKPSGARVALFALAMTYLALSTYYFFVFTLLICLGTGLAALGLRLVSLREIGAALTPHPGVYAVLLGCAAALWAAFWPYYRITALTGVWPRELVAQLMPTAASGLLPPPGTWAWGWLRDFIAERPEGALFPGAVIFLGLAWGIGLFWRRPDRDRALAGALIVAALVVCAAFLDCWGPDTWLLQLPGIAALRVLTRVNMVALPCFALGLGFFLSACLQRVPGRYRWMFLAAALAVLVLDQHVTPKGWPSFAWAHSVQRVSALVEKIPPDARILSANPASLHPGENPWAAHLDAMLAAQRLNIATYNGYSGWLPPLLGLFYDAQTCAALDNWRNAAARIWHPDQDAQALYAGSVFVGLAPCPPDPSALARPQGYHRSYLPEADRRARILPSVIFSPATKTLHVTAAISNLGSQSVHGLGNFHHEYAVYAVADVLDASQTTRTIVLGLLPQSIAPGETLQYAANAAIPGGFLPATASVYLVQASLGRFHIEAGNTVPVSLRQ